MIRSKYCRSRLAAFLLSIGFLVFASNTRVFGQFTFYEFPGGPGTNVPPATLGPDPSGGITNSPVLIYTWAFAVVPGDVLLTETPIAGQTNPPPPSDIIRFFQNPANPNQGIAIFYSDLPDNPLEIPDPADTGLPSQLLPNVAGPFAEVGTEGNNGYHYMATPGMPGAPASGTFTMNYIIISDVPEPGSCVLAGIGGGLLLLLRWRWSKRP